MKRNNNRFTRILAFGPALVLIGVTAFAASGTSIVTSATAADAAIDIVGTVGADVYTDPTPSGAGCPDPDAGGPEGETFDLGSAWDSSPVVSAAACTIAAASNGAGSEILFENAADEDNVFCNDVDGVGAGARDCADGSVTNVVGTGETLAAADQFGIALDGMGGDGTPVAGTGVGGAEEDGSAVTTADTESIWAGIPKLSAAAAQLCYNDVAGDLNCSFIIGAHGQGASQPAGDYSGTINFSAQAL